MTAMVGILAAGDTDTAIAFVEIGLIALGLAAALDFV